MRRSLRLWCTAYGLFLSGVLCAQIFPDPEPGYKGLRISLFQFEVVEQSTHAILLRCAVANTGRYAVAFGKKQPPPAALIVELDTLNVPQPLQGRENLVGTAMLKKTTALAPGEVLRDVLLKIDLRKPASPTQPAARPAAASPSPVPACADLTLDTVFILRRNDTKITLAFRLRNDGPDPVRLTGRRKNKRTTLALNAWFVRDNRLTRGAVLAGGIWLDEQAGPADGILAPGARFSGEIEIGLRERTRFAPNVVLEIDPFQAAPDCNRANNTRAIQIPF